MATNEFTIENMLKVINTWDDLTSRLIDLRLSIDTLSPIEVKLQIRNLEKLLEENKGSRNTLAAHIGQQKRQMVNLQ